MVLFIWRFHFWKLPLLIVSAFKGVNFQKRLFTPPLGDILGPFNEAIRGGAGYRFLGHGFAMWRQRRSRCGSVGERKGRSGGTNGVRDGNPTCAVWCAGGTGAGGRWITCRHTDVVLAGSHGEGRKVRRSFCRTKMVSPL